MKFRSKSEDTRNFVKIAPNESLDGVFRGDPYEFRIHWDNQRSVLCDHSENCSLCKAGNKNKFRFRVNFIVKDEHGKYQAKVMEQGWNFYESLRGLDEMLKEANSSLEHYAVRVTRHGQKLETKYTVLPKPNGVLTPETEKQIELVPLNELGHITEAENEPAEIVPPVEEGAPPPIDDEDIPF